MKFLSVLEHFTNIEAFINQISELQRYGPPPTIFSYLNMSLKFSIVRLSYFWRVVRFSMNIFDWSNIHFILQVCKPVVQLWHQLGWTITNTYYPSIRIRELFISHPGFAQGGMSLNFLKHKIMSNMKIVYKYLQPHVQVTRCYFLF